MTERARILALFGSTELLGQERGNIEALAALRDEGCEILCLTRDDEWGQAVARELERRSLACRKVRYILAWRPDLRLAFLFRNPASFLVANLQLRRAMRRFRPTHVYAFNQLFILNFLPILAASKVPLVYRAGDAPTFHNWLWRKVFGFLVKRASRVVANSRFVKQSWAELGMAESRIAIIYNKPTQRDVRPDPVLVGLAHDPGITTFEYHGQLNPAKGVGLLVDAFERIVAAGGRARLLIAGRMPDSGWARQLDARVRGSALLQGRILFLGYVSDVATLLGLSDVHVCPSIWDEPGANVVMEAKAAARPSIVFPTGGLPEMVLHEVDGHVCRDASEEALVEALTSYLQDPERAARQGRAAHTSLTRFDVERFGANWMRVLTDRTSP